MADTAKRMSSPVNRALTSSSIDFGTNFVKKYYIYIYIAPIIYYLFWWGISVEFIQIMLLAYMNIIVITLSY